MPAIGSSIIHNHQGLGQVNNDYIYNSLYIYIIYYIYIYIDEQPTLIPLVPCTLCFQTTQFSCSNPAALFLCLTAAASGQSLRHQFSLVDYPIHTGLETRHRPWEPCSLDVVTLTLTAR